MRHFSRRDVLKLLAALPLGSLRRSAPPRQASLLPDGRRPPNILILVLDALSAHHMSLYGYRRATTPYLSRFADGAVVFHSHLSAGSFTTPGTASLLTGTYPWSHRAVNLQGTVLDEFRDRSIFSVLGQTGYYRLAFSHNIVVTSLFDQFRSAINRTVLTRELCLQDPWVSEWLFGRDFTPAVNAESLIVRRGETTSSLFLYELYRLWLSYLDRHRYERYAHRFPRGVPAIHDQVFLLEDAVDWAMHQLENMPEPFFAYLHFLPPHDPYRTRKEFVGRFADGWAPSPKPPHRFSAGESEASLADLRRAYDEYIAYADAECGRLLEFLRARGWLDRTYVIITSDHGELFERGIWEHITPVLFQPLIHIPLIISVPGQQARQDIHGTTSSVDVLPTLLRAAGVPVPAWCEGEYLPLDGREAPAGRAVYAVDAKGSSRFGPLAKRTVSLVRDRFKLIHYLGYPTYDDVYELYDLQQDPDELENIYSTRSAIAEELRALLRGKFADLNRRV
jgi:arylsulfatase A-like enzyme